MLNYQMVFVFLLCLSGECAIICYLRQPLGVRRGYPFFFGLVMIEKPRRGLCLGLCWITSLILDEDMYCWHIRYWLDGEANAKIPAGSCWQSTLLLMEYYGSTISCIYIYILYTYTHVCIYNYIYNI